MNSLPHGTFVVFGEERAPEVQMLSVGRTALHFDRLMVASAEAAIAATFGAGFQYAVPAWSTEAMKLMGAEYEGPHRTAVRGICAAIALGLPFESLFERAAQQARAKGQGPGGRMARLVPPAPVRPSPSGKVVPLSQLYDEYEATRA